MVVVLLRVVWGLLGILVSATIPITALEQRVGVLPGEAPWSMWLYRVVVEPFMRYDANHYLGIVEQGYQLEGGNAAFHPLYPLLSVLVRPLLNSNSAVALQVVSLIATVGLCVLFARYVADAHGAAWAHPAATVLLLGPPAFILLAPYNESTFLVCAVGSVWAMHRERWWLAGLLGSFAALTRQQGIALMVPLAWELVIALRQHRIRPWTLGAVLLVPLGYGIFLAYRAIVLGDLATLMQADSPAAIVRSVLVSPSSEQIVTGQRIAWPWEPFRDHLRMIVRTPAPYHLVIDLVLGWAGVLAVLVGLHSMTRIERTYSIVIVVLSLCYYNGAHFPYLSLPRHMLLAFPLFVVLVRWMGNGLRYRMLRIALLISNLFVASMYVRNGWIP